MFSADWLLLIIYLLHAFSPLFNCISFIALIELSVEIDNSSVKRSGEISPLILDKTENFTTFEDSGPPLGVVAKFKYTETTIPSVSYTHLTLPTSDLV